MERLISALEFPLTAFWGQWATATTSRYYWPFLIGGALMALSLARLGRARIVDGAFTLAYWTGPSARADYFLGLFNPIVRALFFAGLIGGAARWGIELAGPPRGGEPSLWLAAALTVSLFVADDFMRWATHWVMHRHPALWAFHKVHHSAETMTFATADRHHFMETLISTVPIAVTWGLVNGAFILLTGIEQAPLHVAGANLLLFAFNLGAGAMRHGPVWVSFGPRVEAWLISPAMHQIHHSVNPRHYDRNFGGTLAVWDRMFGSHYVPTGPEELADGIGLGEEGRAHRSVRGLVLTPFIEAWGALRPKPWGRPAAPAERLV
jgi:sterol desaturase/sphingolipid hydroxylase (fatty acid hydroxylase superfamily)